MAMHWIVIANEAKARIIAADALFDDVLEIIDLAHPEGRWRDADLKSDRSGRFAAGASGGRTAADPQTDPRDVEATRFARTVADLLRKGLLENRFERIVLAAAPDFLGRLRAELDPEVARRVVGEIDKDLARYTLDEIPDAIRKGLSPTAGMP